MDLHTQHQLIAQEVHKYFKHENEKHLLHFSLLYAVNIRDWKQINPTKIEINFTLPKTATSITAVLTYNGHWLHTLPMSGDVRRVYVINGIPGRVYTETFNVDYLDGTKDSASVNVWTTQ